MPLTPPPSFNGLQIQNTIQQMQQTYIYKQNVYELEMEQLKDGQTKLLEQIHMLNNRALADQEEESADEKLRMQQELMFYQENIQLQELNLSEKY